MIFLDFYEECNGLMTTLMGADAVNNFQAFNEKCLRRNDVPSLLNMVKSMVDQGCTADAVLDEVVASELGSGFGADTGHFSVEIGPCPTEMLETKVAAVDKACCSSRDGDDTCENGTPTQCDIECAIHYVPFHEDCNALLQGTFDEQMAGYEQLYGTCLANARRGATDVLRTMYLTNEAWNSESCPVEGSLDFFGDCPNKEPECISEYIGVQPELASQHVHQFYRWQVVNNQEEERRTWGSNMWCLYEISLRGAGNCIYDTRPIATDMQQHYLNVERGGPGESTQGDGTGYSWKHFTDNCNACLNGNTNSYGPDNLFDDPLTYPSGGGAFCSDANHDFGWVAINMTVPTLVTSNKIRARNWNEMP